MNFLVMAFITFRLIFVPGIIDSDVFRQTFNSDERAITSHRGNMWIEFTGRATRSLYQPHTVIMYLFSNKTEPRNWIGNFKLLWQRNNCYSVRSEVKTTFTHLFNRLKVFSIQFGILKQYIESGLAKRFWARWWLIENWVFNKTSTNEFNE